MLLRQVFLLDKHLFLLGSIFCSKLKEFVFCCHELTLQTFSLFGKSVGDLSSYLIRLTCLRRRGAAWQLSGPRSRTSACTNSRCKLTREWRARSEAPNQPERMVQEGADFGASNSPHAGNIARNSSSCAGADAASRGIGSCQQEGSSLSGALARSMVE